MKHEGGWHDRTLFLLAGTAYTFALSSSVLYSTILDVSGITIFIYSCIAVLFMVVFLYNKYTAIIIGFVLVFLVLYLLTHYKAELTEVFLFIRGYVPLKESFVPIIVGFITVIFAQAVAIGLYVRFSFYMLAGVGACVFGIPFILDYKRSDLHFLVFVFCIIIFLAKQLNLYMHNVGREGRCRGTSGRFSLLVMPVAVFIALAAYMLPAPGQFAARDVPDAVSEAYGRINDFFYTAFNPKYFSFESTGFSAAGGRLGGRINLNGDFVMELASEHPVYLSGSVKDIYTGFSWELSQPGVNIAINTSHTGIQLNGAEETAYRLSWLSGNPEGMMPSGLTVNIGGRRTGTIFKPPMAQRLLLEGPETVIKQRNGDLFTDKPLPGSAQYAYDYLWINYESDAAKELLRLSGRGYYNTAGQTADAAKFKQTADSIYEDYLSLPDTVPDRVYELAAMLTQGCDSDYDRIRALEQYLVTFPYTLEPPDTPPGSDFVDYFLFEAREGYCVYYASALAVLSRCIGMPSRYLEGYVSPAKKTDGVYKVTNYQAHAWVEVYFEGFGWAPFEATAPYHSVFNEKDASADKPVLSVTTAYMDYEEYFESMGFSDMEPVFERERTSSLLGRERQAAVLNGLKVFLHAAVSILALAAFFFSALGVGILRDKKRTKRIDMLDNRESAVAYFKAILRIAAVYGYPIRPNETAMSYAARLGKRFAFANETVFMRRLAEIYSKAAFSQSAVSNEERLVMRSAHAELLSFLRMYRLPKPIFIVRKYICGEF